MAKIACDRCGKEIKSQKGLVVTTYFLPFILKKYHNACYAQREKTPGGLFFVGAKPVNSDIATVIALIGVLIGAVIASGATLLMWALPEKMPLLIFLIVAFGFILFSAYPRVVSYYKYEKPLSKK